MARWLWSQGYTVSIPKMDIAPEHDQWREYKDNGDLFITKNGYKQRVEVKGLKVTFMGKRDWPYPDFIVCAKHSFDNAKPKPAYYIIVSADKRALAVVDTRMSKFWKVINRDDSRYYKVAQDFYICPMEYVHWRLV